MLIKDSRGSPSWTLSLGVPVTILLSLKFMFSGISFGQLTFASIDPIAYITGITSVFGFIAQREYFSKKNGNGHHNGNGNGNGVANGSNSSQPIG